MSETTAQIGWTARFVDGTVLRVDHTGAATIIEGDTGAALAHIDAIRGGIERGWPDLPGWGINTDPGVNTDWMALRLAAIGAVEVTGPDPVGDIHRAELAELTARGVSVVF